MTDDLLVSLTGFVEEPGEYPFHHSMTCYDLIFLHAGLQDSLRLAQTYMERGDIFRLSGDGKTRIIIPFSVRDV